MSHPHPSRPNLIPLAALLAAIVAGCGFLTSPTPAPSASGPSPTPRPTVRPTPTPLPFPVASIVLVDAPGEEQPGSRSELAWHGVEAAAAILGSSATRVTTADPAQLFGAVARAAAGSPLPGASPTQAVGSGSPSPRSGGALVVVTVGPAGLAAALGAAPTHPQIQFFVLDQAVAESAPANVHGLIFDQAEAGYLAGVVAAGGAPADVVGFVAPAAADPASAAYLAGLRNGVRQVRASVTVTPSYTASPLDPARGRSAVAALAKAGAGVVVATPDLSGYGAMRQACDQKLPVVALATDAGQLLPDVKGCLLGSILERYDLAIRDAIIGYAEGQPAARTVLGSVASGGLSVKLTDTAPAGLASRLDGVLTAMRLGPPRPTPSPIPSPKPSPKPA